MTNDQIFAMVRSTLVEALNVEEDEVTPTARLRADLNAESIDFLDIVFRLERQFNLKIPRDALRRSHGVP
jgi:acyl carrier protein